ncbi:hypothetical protein D3C72_2243940 [compost metagenome]
MHHAVDGMVGERLRQRGVTHVLHQIDHTRQAALGRHLAHIGRHQRVHTLARKGGHYTPAQKTVGPGHQDAARCQ